MKALRIEPADNVAVVAQDTRKGDVLRHAGGEVTALEDIGLGHKIAVEAVAQGVFFLQTSVEWCVWHSHVWRMEKNIRT